MTKRVQRYGLTAGAMASFTGLVREFIANTTRNSIHVHDGVTVGGIETMRADGVNGALANGSSQGLLSAAGYNVVNGIGSLPVPILQGGTGGATASAARTNLGLGTASVRNTAGLTGQIVSTETGALATGTTLMMGNSDSIPTNVQGDQYMSLSITPSNAASILLIEVLFNGSTSVVTSGAAFQIALFQDATVNALAMGQTSSPAAGNNLQLALTHKMVAGTTSATTFKIRAGVGSAGTTTFNGVSGARIGGGTMASSITITEILP